MIRQAQTYFAGAVSGTALVAGAIVAFVLLVSLQALRDWPLGGLGPGGGGDAPAHAKRGAGTLGGAGSTGSAAAAAGAASKAGARGGHGGGGGRGETGGGVPTSAGSPGPGAAGGGSAPSGNGSAAPAGGGGGGGGSAGSGPSSGGQSTSETLTGAVNETVGGVDQATGGALGGTGVTTTSEELVNGVAGPESTIGRTVDETGKTVGGLLGGGG